MSDTMGWVPAEVNPDVPSVARIYDYLLGGSHNFEPDRAMADKLLAVQPNVAGIARNNRAFLRRVVQFMVQAGVRQFLDLGSGIPTAGNVHEIAQHAAPGSRVVYVDYEGVAVAHSKLLLAGNADAAVLQRDVTRPDDVLNADETRSLIDFSQPVGVLAITIGHYLPPACDPVGVFACYRNAVASGSFLALTHLTDDFTSLHGDEIVETMKSTQNNVFPRTRAQVLELFGDFDLVEPGLVTTSQWHPDYSMAPAVDPQEDGLYAGVAIKP
ncbi:SAM-dependent methyltransferase [Kutzneria sp. NPDC051319]|uniref:SAM-dependent methyltransferase n=1 Tax=Kutzneria sp. NPDC051319 TaxID=3155047 RepID=UPI00343A4251